jgi:hypothetical protein
MVGPSGVFIYFNSPQSVAPAHGARDSLGVVLCYEAGAGALGTRGGPVAYLCQETGAEATGHVAIPEMSRALVAGAGATRHVVAPELPCSRRWMPQDTRACASVLSFIFYLELLHGVPGLQDIDRVQI